MDISNWVLGKIREEDSCLLHSKSSVNVQINLHLATLIFFYSISFQDPSLFERLQNSVYCNLFFSLHNKKAGVSLTEAMNINILFIPSKKLLDLQVEKKEEGGK